MIPHIPPYPIWEESFPVEVAGLSVIACRSNESNFLQLIFGATRISRGLSEWLVRLWRATRKDTQHEFVFRARIFGQFELLSSVNLFLMFLTRMTSGGRPIRFVLAADATRSRKVNESRRPRRPASAVLVLFSNEVDRTLRRYRGPSLVSAWPPFSNLLTLTRTVPARPRSAVPKEGPLLCCKELN